MTQKEYKYSKDNLLKRPQRYQFTEFEGKEFLDAYIDSRKKYLLKLNTNIPSIDELENILENKNSNQRKISATEKRLTDICFELINGKYISKLDKDVDYFLKKFEISKKLLSNYNDEEGFREDNLLENYVMLSLILVIKFKTKYDLRFINTVLKLNDIICSSWIQEIDTEYNRLFSFCLESEIEYVKEIMKDSKVKL